MGDWCQEVVYAGFHVALHLEFEFLRPPENTEDLVYREASSDPIHYLF